MSKTSSKFTAEDDRVFDAYLSSGSKQFGNLHERMKWLIGCKEELREYTSEHRESNLEALVHKIEVAVMDLETEVAYTQPAHPPFARRPRKVGDSRLHAFCEHKKNS